MVQPFANENSTVINIFPIAILYLYIPLIMCILEYSQTCNTRRNKSQHLNVPRLAAVFVQSIEAMC